MLCTTPTEIAAIRATLDEERRPRAQRVFGERALVASLGEDQRETGLGRALREGDWIVSIQLDPPLGGSSEGLVETARTLRGTGSVDFVDINDNPAARARMNGLMAAVTIEREAGIETIPHLTPRDMTLAGLESVLLGAHAEGIRNILAVTGDPPESDTPGTGGVYQVDAIGLVELISQLNRGEDGSGRSIDAPTRSSRVWPSTPRRTTSSWSSTASGARSPPGPATHDAGPVRPLLSRPLPARLGGASPIPLLVGLWPLWSHQLAVRVHNHVPGIVLPDVRAGGPPRGRAGRGSHRDADRA